MARKKNADHLTRLELEIMTVLWDAGPATVQAVQVRLKRSLAYTTVQTMLNVLHRKGKVRRTLRERAYSYRPAVSRRQATSRTLGDLIDRLFGGSAESLVMSLVETRRLTPQELADLNRRIDRAEKEGGDGDA